MADYPIPPWLHPYGDPGELYLQSQRLNASVDEARQRLDAQQQQAAVEAQVRRDALNQRSLEAEQRIQIEAARLDALTGIRRHALDIAQQRNDMAASRAAQQFAAQQQFSQRIASEGIGNAAKIALTTPGLGLTGPGIASLSRAANPPDLNLEPQWTVDPETGKLIGYNRRTGTPHYRTTRAEIPDNLTPRQRARISFLKSELPALDKVLNEGLSKRAESRSDEQISALPKEQQEGAIKLREDARQKRAARQHIADELERLTGETPDIQDSAAVPTVPTAVTTGSIKAQKVKRANELAKQHPDWSREQILAKIAEEFK